MTTIKIVLSLTALLAATFLPGEARTLNREKRQETGQSLAQEMCRRNPNSRFCQGNAPSLPPLIPGPGDSSEEAEVTNPPPLIPNLLSGPYCSKYRSQFENYCRSSIVLPSAAGFCPAYAKICSQHFQPQQVVTPPPLPADLATPPPLPSGGGLNQPIAIPPPIPPTNPALSPQEKQVKAACFKFQPEANKLCSGDPAKLDPAVVDKCRQYFSDCSKYLTPQTTRPSNPAPSPEEEQLKAACFKFQPEAYKLCSGDPAKLEPAVVDKCRQYFSDCSKYLTPATTRAPNLATRPPQGPLTPEQAEERLKKACLEFEDEAELHCRGDSINPALVDRCRQYFADCEKYLFEDDPLKKAANLFSSGVGWKTDQWGLAGIPFYPFNPEGAIGGGKEGKVDFGSWGAGYSETAGVRDFFQAGSQVGGNWYEGEYGGKSNWEVPILPWINGGGGTMVEVPIKEGEFGNPIGINSGYGVGNFFGMNDNTSIDWLNGDVGGGKSWGIPIIGISGNTGSSLSFPSVADFLNIGKGKRRK